MDKFYVQDIVDRSSLIIARSRSKNLTTKPQELFDLNHGIAGYIVSKLRVHDVVTIISVHDVLNVVKYSLNDQKYLKSLPLRVLNGIGTIAFLYFGAMLSKIAMKGVEKYYRVNIVKDSLNWSILNTVLILLWGIFVVMDKYRIFLLSPRSRERIWPDKLSKSAKVWIILLFVLLILIFYELIRSEFIRFDK